MKAKIILCAYPANLMAIIAWIFLSFIFTHR